jgi:hypothetical protein
MSGYLWGEYESGPPEGIFRYLSDEYGGTTPPSFFRSFGEMSGRLPFR